MALILSSGGSNAFELVHTETKSVDPAFPGTFTSFNLDAGEYIFSFQYSRVVTGMTFTITGATLVESSAGSEVPYMGIYRVTNAGAISVSWSSSAGPGTASDFTLNVYTA